MEKISKEEYLIKCKELLDYFRINYSGDTIKLCSGDLSIIMNPKFQFYELFGGYSVREVAEFVAKEEGKKIKWEKEYYG